MHYNSLLEWRRKTHEVALNVRDEILTASSVADETWDRIFALYVLCSFSGLQEAARGLLEAYFDVEPGFVPHPTSPEKKILALISNYSESAKPQNLPWPDAEAEGAPPEYDISNPAFFQLDKWTETHWIPQTDYAEPDNWQKIDDSYDPHQWRTSKDPWTHAICARLLCRVPEGQVADRAAVVEAFEAVDRLFTQLPRRKMSSPAALEWPHGHIFPMKIYFLLAVGIGKHDKARAVFDLACTAGEYYLKDLMLIPALYEVYFESENTGLQLVGERDAMLAVSCLSTALIQRKQNGRQEPLHGVAWPELLRRFSEAAFKVHRGDYEESDDPPESPSGILLPPITPEKLVEVERELGPLPPDLREMVQIANGFKGGWHFMGGGFPGVDRLEATPSGEYELWLGVEPEPKVVRSTKTNPDDTTETTTALVYEVSVGPNEGLKAGPVWVGWGAVENDDFEHVVCPPETWKNINESCSDIEGVRHGETPHVGEYRVIHFAHWEGGGHEYYRSVRHWVASVTAQLERELELSGESAKGDNDDGDNIDEDEGEKDE